LATTESKFIEVIRVSEVHRTSHLGFRESIQKPQFKVIIPGR